jgi:hypothetical protein
MKIQTLFALILFSLGSAFAAPSQTNERVIPPAVAKVWPVGMQRGTTATFTLDGRNLSDIQAVIFDAQGISAKVTQVTEVPEKERVARPGQGNDILPRANRQTVTIEVTAAKDLAPGLHWFRIRTPLEPQT